MGYRYGEMLIPSVLKQHDTAYSGWNLSFPDKADPFDTRVTNKYYYFFVVYV